MAGVEKSLVHWTHWLIRLDRKSTVHGKKKRGSGVCAYVKKCHTLSYDPNSQFNRSDINIELMYFRVSANNQKSIDVFLAYRPPSGTINDAINFIYQSTSEVVKIVGSKEVVIIGDLNIDLLNKKSPSCKRILELGRKLNLLQVISDPTRISKNTSTLIDICFTNINHISTAGVLDWSPSDHFPIYLIKKQIAPVKVKTTFIGRNYTQLGTDEFKYDLLSMPLYNIILEPNPERAWAIYYDIILKIAEKHCPPKLFTITKKKPPYITNEIIQLSKNRQKLFKKALKTKNENDWERAISARSEANIGIRKARRRYILNLVKKLSPKQKTSD